MISTDGSSVRSRWRGVAQGVTSITMGDRLDATKRFVMRTPPYLRLRDLMIGAHRDNEQVARADLARRYLRGSGIEIGALTKPMRVPPGVRVRYVDRMSRESLLREDGPEMEARGLDLSAIPETIHVDDAATLGTFGDRSLDFVIAHHVLEHLEDPIAALETLLRVLRPHGILLLTLPDARFTFDAPRARTTAEHALRDHVEGPQSSRRGHYEEWARLIEGVPQEGVAARAAEYARQDARHHFHVWELEDFLELVRAAALECELLEARVCGIEFAVVLRRLGSVKSGG